MQLKAKSNCPLLGMQPCKELECAWFIKINGKNPNTGQEIEEWGCSMAWLPILLIENSNQQRQTGAAVESFRNEVVRQNDVQQQILVAGLLQPPFPANNEIKYIESST